MEKVKITLLIVILMILFGILIFLGFNFFQGVTGEIIVDYHSYTKAVCNETKYCEDYEITCQGGEIVSFTPTGAAVQFSYGWEDPRDKEAIEKLC